MESYWQRHPGLWAHGDLAVRHDDGSWELRGRADDVLKVSGRRVGPSEIEEAAMAHGGILAAAAIGMPDPRSGQAVWLFVVPQEGPADTEALRRHLGTVLGPGLRPARVIAVADLPRTRNGKILRRVVRGLALGEAPGDLSSLDNHAALDLIAAAL
jgi:acetyl-CoA synthetase